MPYPAIFALTEEAAVRGLQHYVRSLVQLRVLGGAMSRVAADATAFAHRDKQAEERIHEAYPPATYTRLAGLKERYDPTNLFHLNQNIPPARSGLVVLKHTAEAPSRQTEQHEHRKAG